MVINISKTMNSSPIQPLKKCGITSESGSTIQFLPSKDFKDLNYKEEVIKKRLKELAFLNLELRFISK